MNKNKKIALTVGAVIILIVGGIFTLANIAEVQRKKEFVDGNHLIEFKISSCSQFVKCLGKDLENNTSKWHYELLGGIQGAATNESNIIKIYCSPFADNYIEVYTDTSKTEKVQGFKKIESQPTGNVNLNLHERYYLRTIFGKLATIEFDKERNLKDSLEKIEQLKTDSTLHARFYKTCN